MKKALLLTTLLIAGQISYQAQTTQTNATHKLSHVMSAEEKQLFDAMDKNHKVSAAPPGPVRNIAEFEPNEAAIIAYSGEFGIPTTLIRDLTNDTKLIVITSSSNKSSCTNTLQGISGINMNNVQYLVTNVDSYWARDYTGWFIADGNNKVGIIDFVYDRPRPNDDAIPTKQANFLNIPVYNMPVTHTGGNWMCDGMGVGTCTDLVWDENTNMTHAQIDQYMLDYLGISKHWVINDAQGQYIKHIDCFGKFLAVDKVLIDSVPTSDSRYSAYQAAAAYYANKDCSYGYKYKVYRPFTASSANGEPYSNSFICNNKVYVALKGTANDTKAMNVYKAAMPGYTVTGYLGSSATPWLPTDALHCRVHEVADRKMLYIKHVPLHGKVCSTTGYKISANAVSYGGSAIQSGYPKIIYKLNNGNWDSITMTLTNGINYEGTIPAQTNGTVVKYYIRATDASSKAANHPFIGAPDPHIFTAECTVGIDVNNKPSTYFNTYPNPSHGNFHVFVDSKVVRESTIQINNTLGQNVYFEKFKLGVGDNLININVSNLPYGVYSITFTSANERITQQIVIE